MEDISIGERLWILRERKRQTIEDAAEERGVLAYIYQQWERGEEVPPFDVPLDEVKPHEFYAILRRRAGLTRQDVARRIGVTLRAVRDAERGLAKLDKLREFWGIK